MAQSAGGGGVVGSAATDITNPYEAVPCGCIYCFACLAQRIANEEGEGWTCLRCGESVAECRPWNGDVLEASPPAHSQHAIPHHSHKSVGFASVGGAAAAAVQAEAGGVDEKALLREVDPMPEVEISGSTAEEEGRMGLEGTCGLDLGSALDESAEWARASDDSSDDEQSEEYDEDEEEEGEELEYDM